VILPDLVDTGVEDCTVVEVICNRERHHFYLNVMNAIFSCYETEPDESSLPAISLVCQCRFVEQFEAFALKTLLSLSYFTGCAVSCSCAADDALLFNIPQTADRFPGLADLLFPNTHTRIFSSHVESEGVMATVDATLICAVADRNPGRFLLFLFSDGFTDPPNSPLAYDLLSFVPWTVFNFSLLPDDSAMEDQYTIDRPPLATFASILHKRGSSFALFVNGNGADAMSLRVRATHEVFSDMVKHIPIRGDHAVKRLNGIWRHMGTIAKSIESILDGEVSADTLWKGCCRLTTKGNHVQRTVPDAQTVYVDNTQDMFAIGLD
jgi:hypothetical protein